jgi:phospholipase/carboxylesterase
MLLSTRSIASLVVLIVAGACSGGEPTPATTEPAERETLAAETLTPGTLDLPLREGPRRQATEGVPHIQLDSKTVAAVDAELRRRAFQLPGVEDLASDRSLPGARGLALSDDLDIARADVIAGSSEFAHIHPDGSLHVWLAVESAIEVEDKNWGELHPWVDRDGFWDGVVMVYTPESLEELDATIQILVDAYNFVTGATLAPADIP